MPTIHANGVELHYTEHGQGDTTLVFSHGFLMNHRMFEHQIAALAKHFRVIAYDHRCHGDSEVVRRPFGIYDLTDDCAALIDALVGAPVHFVGMSTGGYVGTRLMVRRPDLLRRVVLIDTASGDEPKASLRQYNWMLTAVRWLGVRPVMSRALPMLMGPELRADPARRDEVRGWQASIRKLDRHGLYHFGHAIFGRDSVTSAIGGFDHPVLVLVGEHDVPTPVSKARELVAALPDARLQIIPRAGHTSPVEEPEAVTAAVEGFLTTAATS